MFDLLFDILRISRILFGITPFYVHCLEICYWETFNPSCEDHQVIVIQSAVYGVMEVGKCVKMDYGYLGCSADQLWYLDQKCSGRTSCEVSLGDQALKDRLTIPCPEPYLDVTYTCQKGKPKL